MEEGEGERMHERISVSPASSTLECLPGLFQRTEEEGYGGDYCFSEVSHALTVLNGLNRQRQDAVLCDVVVCVEDYEFPCHRNVLAACSPYFMAMFTGEMRETFEQRITIVDIEPMVMKQLIDYAYTSDITINQDNAQHLHSAANMVQILSIREACSHFLEKEMEASNCIGIHCFAEAHVCEDLAEKAFRYTLRHFSDVVRHDEILLLSRSKLIQIISSPHLNVDNEEVVFQAVIAWVKQRPESRQEKLWSVLEHVRLPLVSPYFLFDKLDTEPCLTADPQCRALMDQAKKHFVLKDRWSELACARSVPRSGQTHTRMLLVIGGEIYNKNYLNNVDCYNLDVEKWIRVKELPFARLHHGTAVSEGRYVYCAGGFNKDKQVLNNVLRYEPMLDRWNRVANMNTARARHGMTALDGYMYVVAGYGGQGRIDSVERYCPRVNRWTFVARTPTPFSRCHATAHNGYMYVAGGSTEPNNLCVDTFLRYSPVTDQWETLCAMPSARCLGGLVALGGLVYAVGGTEDMVTASQKLTCYDPNTDTWTILPDMLEARFDAGVAAWEGKIYVLSGHDGENSFYHSIEEYDTTTGKWSPMTSTTLPYGRCRFGCVAITVPGTFKAGSAGVKGNG